MLIVLCQQCFLDQEWLKNKNKKLNWKNRRIHGLKEKVTHL